MAALIWTIIILLVAAWFFGVFAVNVGWWINVLLAVAVLGIVYQLVIEPLLLSRTVAGDHRHVHRDVDVHEDDIHHDEL